MEQAPVGVLPQSAGAGHRFVYVAVNSPVKAYQEIGAYCGASLHLDGDIAGLMVVYGRKFQCHRPLDPAATELVEVYYRGKQLILHPSSISIDASQKERVAQNDRLTAGDAQELAELWSKESVAVYDNQMLDTLKELETASKDGVAIVKRSVYDESEHTEGTGFEVTVYNGSKKTIKYVTFTVVGYNAVKDPVRDRFKGQSAMQLRGVGPIAPDSLASYTSEYMWHTDLVETVKVTRILIQYMDGTTRTMAHPEKALLHPYARLVLNAPEAPDSARRR